MLPLPAGEPADQARDLRRQVVVLEPILVFLEAVLLAFDAKATSYEEMLRIFWENHDPTQGMRQGNDVGTPYRSAIYVQSPEQRRLAEASREAYQKRLNAAGYPAITTEIRDAPFYYAEDYHQQYLAKNPHGYCGMGGTGVSCPIGTGA